MKEKVITLVALFIGIGAVIGLIAADKITLPHACPERTTAFPFPGSIELPEGGWDSNACTVVTNTSPGQ